MANKKFEIGAKAKAAPAATPLEKGQKTKDSDIKPPVATPEPVALEKAEKGKKAHAAKKASKEQQMLVKEPFEDQSALLTDLQTAVPSEAKVSDGNAKNRKAKVKEQVAVEPVVTEATSASKKGTSDQASEKVTKMKRLTLDIAKPLHKAIKAKAVEDGVPMVDMLRSLLEKHYRK